MKRLLVSMLFLCCFFATSVKALTVTGIIIEKDSGIPVESANVFFANTTIGTTTNTFGYFSLSTAHKGVSDLVVSHLSYEIFMISIPLEKDSMNILIQLKTKMYPINSVELIGNDPNRDSYLYIFKAGVIGTSENSKKCRLINPSVLHFKKSFEKDNQEEWTLNADTDSVLIIKNEALGYTIKYNLEHFLAHKRSSTLERGFYGYPFFEDEISTADYPNRISRLRKSAYEGSKLHFFRSLYSRTLEENGFEVYTVNQRSPKPNDTDKYGLLADPVFIGKPNVVLEQTEKYLDIYNYLVPDSVTGSVVLAFAEPFEVRYIRKAEEERYFYSRYFFKGLEVRFRSQTSIIRLKDGSIRFFSNGSYEKADELITIGYWSYLKLADTLPFNYVYRK